MVLYESTAHALRDGMQRGEFTSTEITRSVLQKIEAQEPTINAFISIDAEGVLQTPQSLKPLRFLRIIEDSHGIESDEERDCYQFPQINLDIEN